MKTNIIIGILCFVCVVFVCCTVWYANSHARSQNVKENFILALHNPHYLSMINRFRLPFPSAPSRVPSQLQPQAQAHPRVIVSMSTLPQRTKHIAQALTSLTMQTLRPHAVLICVPRHAEPFRLDYDLAGLAAIAAAHGAKLLLAEKDYGPVTKLVPALAVCKPDDVLVYLDDDGWYGRELLQRLVQQLLDWSLPANKRVVSNSVGNVYCSPESYNTIPEGAFGVCMSGKAVTYTELRGAMTSVPAECRSCDHYVLSEFFAAKNIRVERLHERVSVKQLEYGFQADALHAERGTPSALLPKRYGACSRALPSAHISVYG